MGKGLTGKGFEGDLITMALFGLLVASVMWIFSDKAEGQGLVCDQGLPGYQECTLVSILENQRQACEQSLPESQKCELAWVPKVVD